MSIAQRLKTIAENEQKVYEAGKKSQYNEFWDAYQVNNVGLKQSKDYSYVFAGKGWTNATFKPKEDIVAIKSSNMFSYSKITGSLIDILNDLGITLTLDSATPNYGSQAIFQESIFTEIPKLEFYAGNNVLYYLFYGCKNLVKVEEFVTHQDALYTNAFYDCVKLEHIVFSGIIGQNIDFRYSPLSKDSIISIVNALSQTSSNRTVTFKKTAINNAFGINVDDESTYPEGSEFYNLRNSKTNWTFSYV